MPFPWARYRRRVALVFAVALVISLLVMAGTNDGRIDGVSVLIAIVDSAVLAVVVAFPLSQRIYRGPRP